MRFLIPTIAVLFLAAPAGAADHPRPTGNTRLPVVIVQPDATGDTGTYSTRNVDGTWDVRRRNGEKVGTVERDLLGTGRVLRAPDGRILGTVGEDR